MTFLAILVGYALLMILFGVIASRRVRETSDFFVAKRGLSSGLIFSTLLAANIGAGSTVGATGLGYRYGLSAWWWVGSAGIGSLILAFTVGPKIWRVARANNLYTVGDYLEFRYNRSVRGLVALLLWLASLTILAGQFIAFAWILNVTAGVSKWVGCLVGAMVTTFYFTAGGLHATARVNVFQLIVKLGGFLLVLIYLLERSGGINKLMPGMKAAIITAGAVENPDAYFDLTGIGATGVWHYIALLVPSFVISPGLLQKLFGARDESAVRSGVGLNALGLLAYAIVPVVLGIMARAQFPNLSNHEQAMPVLLTQALPVWMGGLLLGAIFSAEMSAADAVLFMLSTSLSKDLYQTFIKPQADDRQLMFVVRTTAVVCGVAGALLGILLETVIMALTIFYTLLSAALLLPLLAGLYAKRVTSRGAIITMIVSVTITFMLERLTGGQGQWGVPSLIWGTAAGAVVMMLTSFFEAVQSKSSRENAKHAR